MDAKERSRRFQEVMDSITPESLGTLEECAKRIRGDYLEVEDRIGELHLLGRHLAFVLHLCYKSEDCSPEMSAISLLVDQQIDYMDGIISNLCDHFKGLVPRLVKAQDSEEEAA
jgi:hypothetical protein